MPALLKKLPVRLQFARMGSTESDAELGEAPRTSFGRLPAAR
jgi:hypothetical protein